MSQPPLFTVIIPPQDRITNPDCLQLLAQDDMEAFQWIYKNYSRRTYEYVLLMIRNQQASEDIVQLIFLKIWENRNTLTSVKNFNAYLHVMARNFIKSYWHRRSIEQTHLKSYQRLISQTMVEINDHPSLFQLVQDAVERLPAQQRLVYRLKREYDWKKEKIAATLNISSFTVKAHMQKALRSVKDYVKERIEG